jgi:hypothetical protein
METDFMDKCAIISEFCNSLLVNDQTFADVNRWYGAMIYPLAELVTNGYVVALDEAVNSIDRLWVDFLKALDVEDSGFETLGQVLLKAGGDWLQYVQGEEESDDY